MTPETEVTPDVCLHCGQTEYRHVNFTGVGKVCPTSGMTWRSKSAYDASVRRTSGQAGVGEGAWAKFIQWFRYECNSGARRHLWAAFGFEPDDVRTIEAEDRALELIRSAISPASPSPSLREALERLRPPFRVDAFNEVLAGKDSFQAMLLRDEEPGVAHIVAQNLSDQDAEDIAFVLNSAAALSAQPDAGIVEALEKVIGRMADALDVADRLIERGYGVDTPKEWNEEMRAVAKARTSLAARQAREG